MWTHASESTRERLAILVLGTIHATSAASALVSRAVKALGLAGAKVESIWREAGILVHWGRGQEGPLCLVGDLPPRWWLIQAYRRHYACEAGFRDLDWSQTH